MDLDMDMYVEHLDYLREQGKYPEEMRDWILPLAKKHKENYLEKVLRAKKLWQDNK